MPTYELTPEAQRDLEGLTRKQRGAFRDSVQKFVADLKCGQLRSGLRVKRVEVQGRVWEMTWAPNGRATFEYGDEIRHGEPHIIWRRIGTHDIFREP